MDNENKLTSKPRVRLRAINKHNWRSANKLKSNDAENFGQENRGGYFGIFIHKKMARSYLMSP